MKNDKEKVSSSEKTEAPMLKMKKRTEPMADGKRHIIYYTYSNE
jgi:hypothetical protein